MSETSHKAASHASRMFKSWNPGLFSADADLLPELGTLVARSRDLTRNHGIASGAIQTMVDNVVGTGLRLVTCPEYKVLGKTKEWADEWAQEVESLWRAWSESTECDAAESLNFAGLTVQIFRSGLINGEALALPLWLDSRSTVFKTAIQLIEPDRLSNPEGSPDSKHLRSGIEIDDYGAPIAYWIRKHHPGDFFGLSGNSSEEWERVPVKTAFGRKLALHIHDKERTGQSRGKPVLSAVLPLFKMLDHYESSELQAAVVNSMIAAFIETPMDSETFGAMFGGTLDDYLALRNEWRIRLEGGTIIPVFPGDKVAPFTPTRPNTAYGEFVENVLRHIGTGLNLPFELLMKDFSKTNYSSARAALLEAWRFFTGRRQWLASVWAKPVYELWLEEAVNNGLIKAETFYQKKAAWARSKWIGAGRGWIDPVKEAQASKIRMETGLSTLEDECAQQGLDWEEVLEQRAREKARMEQLGLTLNDIGNIKLGQNEDKE